MRTSLVVIAKEPRPGLAKTRLCPPCEPNEAAAIARACLYDTLKAVESVPKVDKVLALDGETGPWLPDGIEVIPQRGEGLAARLTNAFLDVGGPCLLIGMDTPQVTAEILTRAVEALSAPTIDAVLGPTEDGGWWALGVRRPHSEMFHGVPMSAGDTHAHQLHRLQALGWRLGALQVMVDIDHFADAQRIAREHPYLETTRLLSRLPYVSERLFA